MIDLAKHRLMVFFCIFIFVVSATFLAIKLAQGYRIDLSTKSFKPTGLLVATSVPPGAQVLINGQLKSATNNTLALSPGEYEVEIKKNGFFTWKKKLLIEKELVTQAEAFLFPQVPDLKPLTFHEAQNPRLSPDGTRIVYTVPLPSQTATAAAFPADEAGLWVMDLTDFILNIGREPHQIAKSQLHGKDFGKADYDWSPDAKQIWAQFSSGEKYLLDPNSLNSAGLTNAAGSWLSVTAGWEKEDQLRESAKLKRFPEKLQAILGTGSSELTFSPDGSKILYQATASAEIPEHLIPPVLAASTQKENRRIEPGKFYVYDLKEDKNYLIPFNPPPIPSPTKTPVVKKRSASPTPTPIPNLKSKISNLRWFPTSNHLYWIDKERVYACEYDGTNLTAIYSGPFVAPFVFAAPGANKLVILTQINFDQETKANLYAVSLR